MAYFGTKKRLYQTEWMKERRNRAIEYLGDKCLCGSVSNLEFHHKEPSKKERNISSLLSCRWESLSKELDKCELLCESCHNSIHSGLSHGTDRKYWLEKCRCTECTARKAKKDKEYRLRKKQRLVSP